MDFGTLKSRILALIGRAPADVVYELVTADINQEMRLRVMESTTTIAESATITLPTDFLEMSTLYRDTNPRTILKPMPPQQLQAAFVASGTPCFYAVEDGQLRLSPSPNGSENLVMRYFAKLTDLSDDSDENDVLTTYPGIYVYGALAHHAVLIRDMESIPLWAAAYRDAKKQARADDKRYRYGGDTLTVFPRVSA